MVFGQSIPGATVRPPRYSGYTDHLGDDRHDGKRSDLQHLSVPVSTVAELGASSFEDQPCTGRRFRDVPSLVGDGSGQLGNRRSDYDEVEDRPIERFGNADGIV